MADRFVPSGRRHHRDHRAPFACSPIYEATTRIEIDRENTELPSLCRQRSSTTLYQDLEDYIETQSKILTSETLALQTIKSLHLDQDPRFGGQPLKSRHAGRRSRRARA